MTTAILCSMNAKAGEKTQTVVTTGAAIPGQTDSPSYARDDLETAGLLMKYKQMPRLVVIIMPSTDTGVISAGKQYVDSASGVVEEVFLKNKFLIVDVNQHIFKTKSIARASKLWLQASYRIRMRGVDGVISSIYDGIT